MAMQNVGILHPGDMGISVAVTIKNGGHNVYWVSEGRSEQTRTRAEQHGLTDAGTLASLCETSTAIVSVCPPAPAEAIAASVIAHGFKGLYVDANAISPQRAERIGQLMTDAGVTFVDGGIIGGPAWKPNSTWLYLSGSEADTAAALFSAGPLETSIVGAEIGKASALKMCYAAYSKGTTALLCAVLAAAEALDVRDALDAQWSRDNAGSAEKNSQQVRRVTAKAWRFSGEMEEIAATFSAAGLPGGFHQSAAELYERIAGFKNAEETPPLDAVLAALLESGSTP
jgi:3-hydroxyisobutyrate dehydrogenase-like beta-hydroxyacid dehydrogenase